MRNTERNTEVHQEQLSLGRNPEEVSTKRGPRGQDLLSSEELAWLEGKQGGCFDRRMVWQRGWICAGAGQQGIQGEGQTDRGRPKKAENPHLVQRTQLPVV